MGRRDAVQFTLEIVAEWRRLGARVTFEPGWETRGNGTTANYEGVVVHHTVGNSTAGNPLPSKNVLKDGRVGLSGPLCNSAGPYCEEGDPWIHVFAAHPSNNAGASGGKAMGPLPVTSLFNPRVWGHEIDYLGDRPMAKGQMKAGLIMSRGVVNVLGRDASWVRAHAETSVTGKWDPGYAPGKTIDMAAFRQSVGNANFAPEDDDMPNMSEFLNHPAFDGGPSISQFFLDLHQRSRAITRDGQQYEVIQEIADGKTLGMAANAKLDAILELLSSQVTSGGLSPADVETLLARVEDIVKRNRAALDVRVTPAA